jgi:hypothetical protein
MLEKITLDLSYNKMMQRLLVLTENCLIMMTLRDDQQSIPGYGKRVNKQHQLPPIKHPHHKNLHQSRKLNILQFRTIAFLNNQLLQDEIITFCSTVITIVITQVADC